jgi:hypothetical protein
MVSLSGAPRQSTAPFTMLPCGVTHQESSGITGKLCFSSTALSHNNRRVPVRRRSLSKAVQEGGRHTHPQSAAMVPCHLSPISLNLHSPQPGCSWGISFDCFVLCHFGMRGKSLWQYWWSWFKKHKEHDGVSEEETPGRISGQQLNHTKGTSFQGTLETPQI